MAVEPHSLGARPPRLDRSGPTWAQALAAWPAPKVVAADGGSGFELGLALATKRPPQEATQAGIAAVPLRGRLDVFHT